MGFELNIFFDTEVKSYLENAISILKMNRILTFFYKTKIVLWSHP